MLVLTQMTPIVRKPRRDRRPAAAFDSGPAWSARHGGVAPLAGFRVSQVPPRPASGFG